MNIALIGFGKMGQIIKETALRRGHKIPLIVDITNPEDFRKEKFKEIDVAIEFTRPEAAVSNIKKCVDFGIPVVSGTTGWMKHMNHVKSYVQEKGGSFFYSSNYSLGVNIFFLLNKYLAKVMNSFESYDVSMEETHHTQKLDAPSGTAITLAEGILDHVDRKESWINDPAENEDQVSIISKRLSGVPGTHSILYSSKIDDIEISHTAHSRDGFALGAVIAAEWIKAKKGCFGMNDMLEL